MTVDQLYVELTILESLERYDAALDLHMLTLTKWGMDQEFEKIDQWLDDDRIFSFSDDIWINVFMVTRTFRTALKNRDKLYNTCKEFFLANNEKSKAETLERFYKVSLTN